MEQMNCIKFFIGCLLFHSMSFSATGQAQTSTLSDSLREIDKLFDKTNTGTPGGVLSISRNGQILYQKAYGMADLEHNVVNTTETIFEAGSVSKQFTAASILLLVKEGKIGLTDDIRKYFPDFPDYGYTITVEHLLHHTSGLRDWGSIAAIGGWPRGTRKYTTAHVKEIIWRQKQLNFTPGEEYSYSNSNFNMLMLLVEKVSGESLQQFTREHLFLPIGMSHTQWRDNYNRVVPGRAIAYAREKDSYEQNMPFENTFGHGALLTTAGDLEKWNQRWSNNALGVDINTLQRSKTKLNNGTPITYACGVVVDSINGFESISHTGATAGYRALLAFYPQKKLSVVFLSNDAGAEIGLVNTTIADLFLGKPAAKMSSENVQGVVVPKERLNGLTGIYQHARQPDVQEFDVRDDSLIFKTWGVALTPVSENKFVRDGTVVEFPAGIDKPAYVFIKWTGGDTATWYRVKKVEAGRRTKSDFTGNYHSDEADVTVTITVKDAKLQLFMHPDTYLALDERFEDGFFDENESFYRFVRNSKGNVTGFKMTVSRVRNLLFKKMN
jgi:CubicO group peptidase (beta-lactamase class C family)